MWSSPHRTSGFARRRRQQTGVPDRSLRSRPIAPPPQLRALRNPRWRAGLSRGRPFIAARRPPCCRSPMRARRAGRGDLDKAAIAVRECSRRAPEYRSAVTAPTSSHVAKPTVPVRVRPHAGPASPARLAQKPAADRAYSVAVQPKSTNIWMNRVRRVRARCATKCCGRCSCLACRRLPPPMVRRARPSRRFCRALSQRSSAPRRQAKPCRRPWICASMMR